jgi:hypothetical protein
VYHRSASIVPSGGLAPPLAPRLRRRPLCPFCRTSPRASPCAVDSSLVREPSRVESSATRLSDIKHHSYMMMHAALTTAWCGDDDDGCLLLCFVLVAGSFEPSVVAAIYDVRASICQSKCQAGASIN